VVKAGNVCESWFKLRMLSLKEGAGILCPKTLKTEVFFLGGREGRGISEKVVRTSHSANNSMSRKCPELMGGGAQ